MRAVEMFSRAMLFMGMNAALGILHPEPPSPGLLVMYLVFMSAYVLSPIVLGGE